MSAKLLFFFSFFMPLQFALNPSPSIDLALIRVLIIFLFIFWLFGGLLKKNLTIPVKPNSLFIYLFIFFSVFSLFFTKNILWGVRKIAFILSIFPIYLIFSDIIKKIDFQKIIQGLVWGSFAVSLIGILQFFLQFIFGIEKIYYLWGKFITPLFLGKAFSTAVSEHSSWLVNISGKTVFRAISIFPDPHMFAFYLGMTAPLALTLFIHSSSKKIWPLIMFFCIFTATLLTFSRGGYLGLIASSLIIIIYFIKKTQPSPKKIIGAILGLSLIIGLLFSIDPIRIRFLDSFNFQEGSNRGRMELWSKAIDSIKERPLGVGIGNLSLTFLPTASYRDPIYAHNLYLDIAVELGVLAFLSFIIALFLTGKTFWEMAEKNILFLGLLASLSFFATYSLVETPLYSVHILTLFFIILSFSNVNYSPKNN